MRRLALSVLSLFVLHGAAAAASGGSSYSLFGIGDLHTLPGTRSHGMGYAGMGLAGTTSVNPLSPGSWAHLSSVRLEAGMGYEGFGSTDGRRSIYRATVSFNGVTFALPVSSPHGVTFVAGFLPYSAINYDNYTTGSQAGLDYTVRHFGTGGISEGIVGLSWAPVKGLALGTSLGYLFGSGDRTRVMAGTGTSASTLASGLERRETTAHGLHMQFGVLADDLGAIAAALRPFSFGLSVATRAYLDTDERTSYEYLGERDSSANVTGSTLVPERLAFGLGYRPGGRYGVAADVVTQPWSTSSSRLKDSYRLSVGAERLPSSDPSAPFLERVTYRAGFTWYATPYRVNDRDIAEWGITAGLGFPLAPLTRLETSLEFGGRGTTEAGLIRDDIWRLHLSLSVGEIWFIRPQEE